MKGKTTQERFLETLRHKRERAERNRREENPSFWSNVGLFGVVGWSITVPMVLGLLVGRLIDKRFDSGAVYTVFLMLVGLGFGCYNVWRLISRKR